MNNLKTYIKMCAKATDIQYLHKPAVCDRYVCSCEACKELIITPYYIQDYDMDYLNKRDLTNVEPNYANQVRSADVCSFVAYYHGRCKEDLSYIWLPRQDQLQEMVWEELAKYCSDKMNSLTWGIWNFYNKIGDLDSMEQLWLAFVMKGKFNKTWEGEEWIN